MKKTVLTFCLLIFAIGTFAQKTFKEEDHLKFMGLPLCGDISGFSKKLFERANAIPTSFSNGLYSFKEEVHLKFMGIPLCGDISGFSKKLVERANAIPTNFSNGLYSFKGTFAGYDADIHVCFNNKNREVYQAYTVVDNKVKERAVDVFNEFKTLLCKKYPDSYTKDSQANGFDSFVLWPKINRSAKKFDKDNVYGKISLQIQYNEQLKVYGVFLVYEDRTYEVQREESKLADF